jgi:protein TonB
MKPLQAPHQFKYIAPKVVEDTSGTVNMLVTDMVMDSLVNVVFREDTATVTYSPPVNDIVNEEPEPFVFVEEQPLFPGGKTALLKFIAENTRYPADALENNIQGKVFVRFVVSSDGSVKRVEILRGLHPALDAEAIRVVSSLPAWTPGRQNGKPVPVWFNLPVTFSIINY